MAGIIGLRAEDMEQVDALRRARLDFPNGFPMVRPHVRAPVLVRREAGVEMELARFGFSRRFPSMNARVEKLTVSPLWRGLFGKHHGVVPLSYIVEWVERDGSKHPYLIQRKDGRLILAPALVGDYHEDRNERAFAICTREPNAFVRSFHERMIGMCTPHEVETWLRPQDHSQDELLRCIGAPADDDLVAVPTSPDITKRKAGDWSALVPTGPPVTWADVAVGKGTKA